MSRPSIEVTESELESFTAISGDRHPIHNQHGKVVQQNLMGLMMRCRDPSGARNEPIG